MPQRKAIVTGASRGIGKAIADLLRDDMFQVHEFNRSDGNDVRNRDHIRAFVSNIGNFDLLVNNAGICQIKPFTELRLEDWQETIDTNLNGVFNFCHIAVPYLSGGDIINIGSRGAIYPSPNHVAYVASKAAVMQFTEALALDLRPRDIRVGCILPGRVATRLSGLDETKNPYITQPEDVAEAVLNMVTLPRSAAFGHVEIRSR